MFMTSVMILNIDMKVHFVVLCMLSCAVSVAVDIKGPAGTEARQVTLRRNAIKSRSSNKMYDVKNKSITIPENMQYAHNHGDREVIIKTIPPEDQERVLSEEEQKDIDEPDMSHEEFNDISQDDLLDIPGWDVDVGPEELKDPVPTASNKNGAMKKMYDAAIEFGKVFTQNKKEVERVKLSPEELYVKFVRSLKTFSNQLTKHPDEVHQFSDYDEEDDKEFTVDPEDVDYKNEDKDDDTESLENVTENKETDYVAYQKEEFSGINDDYDELFGKGLL